MQRYEVYFKLPNILALFFEKNDIFLLSVFCLFGYWLIISTFCCDALRGRISGKSSIRHFVKHDYAGVGDSVEHVCLYGGLVYHVFECDSVAGFEDEYNLYVCLACHAADECKAAWR